MYGIDDCSARVARQVQSSRLVDVASDTEKLLVSSLHQWYTAANSPVSATWMIFAVSISCPRSSVTAYRYPVAPGMSPTYPRSSSRTSEIVGLSTGPEVAVEPQAATSSTTKTNARRDRDEV